MTVTGRLRSVTVLGFCWLLALPCLSLGQDEEPPARPGIPTVGRPTDHFYNAASKGLKLKVEATPTELTTDQWLTLTLKIRNLLNPADVEKPSLKHNPDFAGFQIEEAESLDPLLVDELPGERTFVYKLRPASTELAEIPEIPFYYFNPQIVPALTRPQDRFPKATTNAVAIRVAEPPPLAAPRIPLVIPPGMASYIYPADIDQRPAFAIGVHTLWIGPLFALVWILLWHLRYPSASRTRKATRSRAARRALRQLQHAGDATAADIVLGYLRERFDLPPGMVTFFEVAQHLGTSGVSSTSIDAACDFLQQSDLFHYGPSHSMTGLTERATQLILILEESKC